MSDGLSGVGTSGADEGIGCLKRSGQARLEDAWPAEAPRSCGRR
jgi:hypothetical protein